MSINKISIKSNDGKIIEQSSVSPTSKFLACGGGPSESCLLMPFHRQNRAQQERDQESGEWRIYQAHTFQSGASEGRVLGRRSGTSRLWAETEAGMVDSFLLPYFSAALAGCTHSRRSASSSRQYPISIVVLLPLLLPESGPRTESSSCIAHRSC